MAQYMTCPSGGTFFICTNQVPGGFVGCCNTSNACTSQGCGSGGLLPAGFDNTALGGAVWKDLHDQQCSTPKTFWSCNDTNPTFWGCCNTNPCNNNGVCPSDDLMPAFLSNNPLDWSFFTENNTSFQSTSTSGTVAGLSTATSSSHLPTASGSALTGGLTQSKSSTNVGAIAGGAVGGFLALVALVAGIWWFLKRKSTRQAEARQPEIVYAETRYSGVPTLVPSKYPGSPAKSTIGSSPDPNQYSYESTPRIGGVSPYPSGVPGNVWPSNQGYQQQPESRPDPAWGNPVNSSHQVVELGGAPVYNEMPGE